MPYIKPERRKELDDGVFRLATDLHGSGNDKGDLNYVITSLIHYHLKHVGIRYSTLSDITGVLNDVKVEFERRIVAPYEDKKIAENGNIKILEG